VRDASGHYVGARITEAEHGRLMADHYRNTERAAAPSEALTEEEQAALESLARYPGETLVTVKAGWVRRLLASRPSNEP
jgi:hypothetical protein